jgi:hypothetical protein
MSARLEELRKSDKALEYADYIAMLRDRDTVLADELAELHGVDEILQWMQHRGLSSAAVDIVGQYEFSYDFLVQLAPQRWLSFGLT